MAENKISQLSNTLLSQRWSLGKSPKMIAACQRCGNIRIITLGNSDGLDSQDSLIAVCEVCYPKFYKAKQKPNRIPETRILIGYANALLKGNKKSALFQRQEKMFDRIHAALENERRNIWVRTTLHFTVANGIIALLGFSFIAQVTPDVQKMGAWTLVLLNSLICWKWYVFEIQGAAVQAWYNFYSSVLEKFLSGTMFYETLRSDETIFAPANFWAIYMKSYSRRRTGLIGRLLMFSNDLIHIQFILPLVYFLVPLTIAILIQFLLP